MPGQAPDRTGVKILDAASRVLADFGLKRATVELVAKSAGVSHMTVYRRWPSKSDLFRTAVLRDVTAILDAAFEDAAECDSHADELLRAFTDVVWTVRSHPMMQRELSTEPESLLVSTATGSVMEIAVPLVAERIVHLADGDPPIADVEALADVFVRLAHSLVLMQHPDQPLTTRSDVALYARRCFGPVVEALAEVAASPAVVHAGEATPVELRAGRPRLQLVAATMLAILLVGAGSAAAVLRTGESPVSPADLTRNEQRLTPTSTSALPLPVFTPVPEGVDVIGPDDGQTATTTAPGPVARNTTTKPATSTHHPTSAMPSAGGGRPELAPPPFHRPGGPLPGVAPMRPPGAPNFAGPNTQPGTGLGGPRGFGPAGGPPR